MGCKCKQTYNEAIKLSEDNNENNNDNWFISNIFNPFIMFLSRVFFCILAIVLIIIGVPFFLVYISVCIILGKEPHFSLKKIMLKGH